MHCLGTDKTSELQIRPLKGILITMIASAPAKHPGEAAVTGAKIGFVLFVQ